MQINFLPPGHTHSNIDQKYAVISQKIRNSDLLLLEHVVEEVKELFSKSGPLTSHFTVPVTSDFDKYFSGRLFKLTGHGTIMHDGVNRRLHAFKIESGRDGEIGMFYKEHDEAAPYIGVWDSMQNGTWSPVQVVKFDRPRPSMSMSEKYRVRTTQILCCRDN